MSIPKRHHYVPRFILANFVDKDGKLWVKKRGSDVVWPASPENAYVERHRYSAINAEGERDPELEGNYAALEGLAKPVIDNFIEAGRIKSIPTLTDMEKAVWDEFLYHQMKRVPNVTTALENKRSWAERIEDAIVKLQKRGLSVDQETLDELRSPSGLARMKQNATVQALSADSPLIRLLLAGANVQICTAPVGRSFVISSHPIAGVRLGLENATLNTSEMWFPIASDTAVRLAFGEPHSIKHLTAEQVDLTNRQSFAQGEYIAGSSTQLLESII